jgi:hypothetical protein
MVRTAPSSNSCPVSDCEKLSPGPPTPVFARKTISCHSSEVSPFGAVAAAVTGDPASIGVGSRALNDAFPEASVVTWIEPR